MHARPPMTKRLVLVLHWLVWVVWLCPAVAAPFGDTFGMVVKFSQGQPASQLQALPELGVKWVRDTVPWADVERTPGEFTPFPTEFRDRLAFYKKHDIGVVFILAYANTRAYPLSGPDRLASFNADHMARYALWVADQFKAAGVRFALEVWNEPHNFQMREFLGGHADGRPPSPWMTHYARMIRAVSAKVKSRHPDAPILSSEDLWEAHRHLAETGLLPEDFADIGIHPYVHGPHDGPEFLAPPMAQRLKGLLGLEAAAESFDAAQRALREFTKGKTGTMPDLWITEWGWRIGWAVNAGTLDEQGVAAMLPRAYMVGAASGAKATFWFSMHDSVDGPWGLIDSRQVTRPAFKAMRVMNQQVGRMTLTGWLGGQAPNKPGVCGMVFQKGTERKVALWNTTNHDVDIEIPLRWAVGEVVAGFGANIQPQRTASGWRLKVGRMPLYVSTSGKHALHANDLN